MERAIELAKKCEDEKPDRPSPRVGVVIVRNGEIIAESYRGQRKQGDHAEFCALSTLPDDVDLSDAVVYSTLEPCTARGTGKTPCAMRLAQKRASHVVIGIYDPDPRVYRRGWKILHDAGAKLRDFPPELRHEISVLNTNFLAWYTERRAMAAEGVAFDCTKNNGKFLVGEASHELWTRWGAASHNLAHAYDDSNHVALATYATEFDQIDDPSALDFSSRVVTVKKGAIAVFRNGRGDHALAKVVEVLSPTHGDDRTSITFDFEIRTKRPA